MVGIWTGLEQGLVIFTKFSFIISLLWVNYAFLWNFATLVCSWQYFSMRPWVDLNVTWDVELTILHFPHLKCLSHGLSHGTWEQGSWHCLSHLLCTHPQLHIVSESESGWNLHTSPHNFRHFTLWLHLQNREDEYHMCYHLLSGMILETKETSYVLLTDWLSDENN